MCLIVAPATILMPISAPGTALHGAAQVQSLQETWPTELKHRHAVALSGGCPEARQQQAGAAQNASQLGHQTSLLHADVPQGCTIGYAMLAALPDMNAKISVMIHMGPVVFVDFFRAPLMSNWAVAKNAQVGGHQKHD